MTTVIQWMKTWIAYYKTSKRYEYKNFDRVKYANRMTNRASWVEELDTYYKAETKSRGSGDVRVRQKLDKLGL